MSSDEDEIISGTIKLRGEDLDKAEAGEATTYNHNVLPVVVSLGHFGGKEIGGI